MALLLAVCDLNGVSPGAAMILQHCVWGQDTCQEGVFLILVGIDLI
jgi:hypothetical protein